MVCLQIKKLFAARSKVMKSRLEIRIDWEMLNNFLHCLLVCQILQLTQQYARAGIYLSCPTKYAGGASPAGSFLVIMKSLN